MKPNLLGSGLLTAAACLCLEMPVLAATGAYPELDSKFGVNATAEIAQTPENTYQAWGNECSNLVEQERFSEAIAACDRAVTLKPDYSLGLTNRCVALLQLDRYQDAVESCRRALTGDGNWGDRTEASGWLNFGGSLILFAGEKPNPNEAIPLLQQALLAFDKSLEIEPANSNTRQLRNELERLIQDLT
ncbi:tetratricopeptide repeat protein [Oscillatoria acuminata]|nr:tetratricopeptide repeat protein [Oscillatoria acuminata]